MMGLEYCIVRQFHMTHHLPSEELHFAVTDWELKV